MINLFWKWSSGASIKVLGFSLSVSRKQKALKCWVGFDVHTFVEHLVFQVCAIVGGTFTVAGILDSLTFSASEMIRKKIT